MFSSMTLLLTVIWEQWDLRWEGGVRLFLFDVVQCNWRYGGEVWVLWKCLFLNCLLLLLYLRVLGHCKCKFPLYCPYYLPCLVVVLLLGLHCSLRTEWRCLDREMSRLAWMIVSNCSKISGSFCLLTIGFSQVVLFFFLFIKGACNPCKVPMLVLHRSRIRR